MLFANLGLFLFSKEVITLLADKSYKEVYPVIPILSFVYVLSMQNRFFSTVIVFHKKTWILSVGSIVRGLANLGLNIIFVPLYGYIAAAITTIFSMFILLFWGFYWSQKLDKIKYHYSKMVFIFIIYMISIFVGYLFLFKENLSIFNFLTKSILFCVTGLIFILLIDRGLMNKIFKYRY